jgi:predicted Ser/Thr protein kinase/tetratricopeptide (TPR) repeat protein
MPDDTVPTSDSLTSPELDELFDLLIDAAQAGEEFDLALWLADGRGHLRQQAEHLARVASGVTTPDEALPSPPGFTIIDELGRGGMGVVYCARQHHPKRTVALKVTRATLVSSSARRRFELEAELLARLEHPGIARIYASGIDPVTNVPFFAMELVEGRPLDEHARELSTRERLDLLAQVCDAVEHAHQKGIVHRDLKPSNILVDSGGKPRILDFGVARVTDTDVSITTLHTDVGALIGTVPYMSPEQAAGDPAEVDTRSDVYALGVIAYRLLTGRLPYNIENRLVHEAVRVIREQDPTPLSSVNRALRGDVQTIVHKALEKEKPRRYQSASALADDLRRYLDNIPIAARPPSATYQIRKFARRNQALVAGLVATFVVLVAGIVVSTVGWSKAIAGQKDAEEALINLVRTGFQRGDAEIIRERAEAAGLNMVFREEGDEQFFLIDFSEGQQIPQLAAYAAEIFEWLEESRAAAAEARDAAQASLEKAEAAATELGQVAEFQADTISNINITEFGAIIRDGLIDQVRVATTEEEPSGDAVDARIAEFEAMIEGTDFSGLALSALDQTVFKWARVTIDEQFAEEYPVTRARLLQELATTLTDLGLLERAVEPQRTSLEVYRAELGEDEFATLRALNNTGYLLERLGRRDEALEYFLQARDGAIRVLGPDNRDTLVVHDNVGNILRMAGRFEEAEQSHMYAYEARASQHARRNPQSRAALRRHEAVRPRRGIP